MKRVVYITVLCIEINFTIIKLQDPSVPYSAENELILLYLLDTLEILLILKKNVNYGRSRRPTKLNKRTVDNVICGGLYAVLWAKIRDIPVINFRMQL